MALDPRIILAGQPADILGAMQQGNALAGQVQEQQQRNALAQLYQTDGAGIAAGDQVSLNRLAAFDPMAAFDIRTGVEDRQARSEDRDYRRQRDAATDARNAQLDERADHEWQFKLAEHARTLSEAERTQQADQITRVLAGAKHFHDQGDQAGYDQWLMQNQLDPGQYSFGQFPALAAQYGEAAKILAGGVAEVGLNPIYGRDGEGNPVVMQLGKDGRAVQTALPEGVSVDLGVQSQERAAGSARGKAEGEAQAAMPAAAAEAEHVIGLVDQLIDDPYLPQMLGPIRSRLPNTTTEAARVQSRMDQVAGQGFMAARQFLRGQGQITDFESRRAEAAMSRMNAAQSYEDYVDALREFQDAVRVGLMKTQLAANRGELQGQQAAPRRTEINGYTIEALD